MDKIREEVKELQIGLKVRRLRQERRLTLQDLAEATGLSKPLLSQIENDQVIPPLSTLLRIAKAFKVPLQNFFQEEGSSEKCILVRAGESRRLPRRPNLEGALPPYTYHSLAYGKKNRNLEPFLVEFEAREWSEELQVSHEGEEFLFLLEGELELHYGEKVMEMGPGDSVYYDSAEPHGYVVKGAARPRAVAVLYSRGG
jgi:transcriptional regulator with XRE-family HTH domain